MASSLAAAIAAVEGPELEAILRLPPRRAAPTPEHLARAFEGFDYREIRDIARSLVWRYRCSAADAEDATHGAVEYLLHRPDLLAEGREKWLRYLRVLARFRLFEMRSARRPVSLEVLRETSGDATLDGARPVEPEPSEAIEDARSAPLPLPGEQWSERQMIGALQRFSDREGRPPAARECTRFHRLPSSSTLRKRFGTFAAALRAAGLTAPAGAMRRRPWTALEAAEACFLFCLFNWHWPEEIDLRLNPDVLPPRGAMIRCLGSTRSGEVREQALAILAGSLRRKTS